MGAPTLTGVNSITTERASTMYISGAPQDGVNNTISYPSGVSIGYVPNQIGAKFSSQLSLERSDGDIYSGMYIEDSTNRLVVANASISGGGGLGMYVSETSSIKYSTIPSRNDITPTVFAQLKRDTSTFYSTEANAITITNGGLYTQTIALNPVLYTVTEGCTVIITPQTSVIVLKAATPLTNLIVTLPTNSSSINGKMLYLTTTQDITNITLSNTISQTTLLASSPKRFVNVVSDDLWYNV
jgi:hypothetical protein